MIVRIKFDGIEDRPVFLRAVSLKPWTRTIEPVYTASWDEAATFPSVDAAMRFLGRCYPESRFNEHGDLYTDRHKFNVANISFPGS
ncbi:MAG TPA: hypothetical protein VN719_09510 [Gemmatimonadales bacterium]|nr:hypothetical protein [Gemmatimonadales bacterium]